MKALTPAALLLGLLQANPAAAQEFTSAGVGAFVGYGAESVAWGFEVFGSAEMEDDFCRTTPRKAFGPLLRLTLYGASAPSFTLTGYAGSELLEPGLAAIGELGLTVGKQPHGNGGWGLSPHTGFGVEWYVLNSFSQQERLLDTYPVAGGVRFKPLVAQSVAASAAATGATSTIDLIVALGSQAVGQQQARARSRVSPRRSSNRNKPRGV